VSEKGRKPKFKPTHCHPANKLVAIPAAPYLNAMRPARFSVSAVLAVLSTIVAAGVSSAQPVKRPPPHKPTPAATTQGGPRALGTFGDWTAATHDEAGETVCYAFTIATQSAPALPGRSRVVLTVTDRPTARDVVAISAGFTYATGAEVTAVVDQTAFPFYTSQRSAFAREGRAVVAALEKGRVMQARSPGPRNERLVDTFSLRGFHDAFETVRKACPAS
jgi:hypothetical protein